MEKEIKKAILVIKTEKLGTVKEIIAFPCSLRLLIIATTVLRIER
jgi:hypothetical protein